MGTGSTRAWRPAQMAEPFAREGLELEEARSAVLSRIQPLQGVETLPLLQALGRVLVGVSAVAGLRGAARLDSARRSGYSV